MKEKINSFGACALLVSLSCASFYGIFSSYIINKAKTSSIISIIIGFIISIFLSKIILKSFTIKPNLTINEKIKELFPKTSKIINLLLIISSLCIYILLTYRLTSFLSSQYLIETPKYYLLLLILFVTYYISRKSKHTIVRVSIISLYLALFIFLFDFFSLINKIDIDNFLPLLTVSNKDIITTSIIYSIYFSTPLFFINIFKFDDLTNKEKFIKYYYRTNILSFLITLISISTCIGVYGINVANLFDYPLYTVLKRISIFNFLESLENMSIMLWIIFIINSSSIFLHFIFNTIKSTFNLKDKTNNIIQKIIIVISFILPIILFMNNNYVEEYKYINIPLIFKIIILLITLLIIIKDKLKN